jgi:hypothetical protein
MMSDFLSPTPVSCTSTRTTAFERRFSSSILSRSRSPCLTRFESLLIRLDSTAIEPFSTSRDPFVTRLPAVSSRSILVADSLPCAASILASRLSAAWYSGSSASTAGVGSIRGYSSFVTIRTDPASVNLIELETRLLRVSQLCDRTYQPL